jgi:5-carboxymethyl-2-hydroxymuconate isomerase
MPHLVILYTPQLERETDMPALCRTLADTMLSVKDESGAQVFPTAGTRVLAYPAVHHAVADGERDYAFAYFHLRMGKGRSTAVHRAVGEALAATVRGQLAPVLAKRPLGLTLQIDEGHEVFDAKLGNLHPLFGTG